MTNRSLSNLNAPDLVKEWKKLVNNNVNIGRDAHMFKEALNRMTPEQLLLGIYQYKGQHTVTIPQFLRQEEDWLIEDEGEAKIELAVYVSNHEPPAYWIWLDTKDEVLSGNTTTDVFGASFQARRELIEWADKVLG